MSYELECGRLAESGITVVHILSGRVRFNRLRERTKPRHFVSQSHFNAPRHRVPMHIGVVSNFVRSTDQDIEYRCTLDPSEIERVHDIEWSDLPRECLRDIGPDRIRVALSAWLCQPVAAGFHRYLQQRELRVD